MGYAVAIVMAVAATAASAYSQYQQGEYQKDMADYQARVAQQQAARKVQASVESGAEEDRVFRKKAQAQRGTNIKNIALSGITMTGSPLLVMTEIADEVEQESYNIRRSARTTADDAAYQGFVSSQMYKAQGQNAYTQGVWGAGTTLLQGGSKIASMSSSYGGSGGSGG